MLTDQDLESVLVTGGCGFVGHHVLARIKEVESTCRLCSIDIVNSHNKQSSVQYYDCDITSQEAVMGVILKEEPRVIIHAACPPSNQENKAHYNSRFQAVNVDGTRHIIAAARAAGVQALILTSSSSTVHDNYSDLIKADESLPILRPPVQTRVYTLTKADAEELVFAANELSVASPGHEIENSSESVKQRPGLLTTILRPCTTFGESDPAMFAKVLGVGITGKARFQMGSGKNMYSFLYVANLAHAHVLAAKALLHAAAVRPDTVSPAMRVDGQAFHITNGDEEMPFWDFTRTVAAVAGHPVALDEIVVIPQWVGLWIGTIAEWVVWALSLGRESNLSREGIRFSCITRTLDGGRARRVLGYRPLFSVQEGIERSVGWYMREWEREKRVKAEVGKKVE